MEAMMLNKSQSVLRTLLLILFSFSGPLKAEDVAWTYEDQALPAGWASLTSNASPPPLNYPYAECAIGTKQTPIDIRSAAKEKPLNQLTVRWKTFKADFFNSAHAVQVQPYDGGGDSGTLLVGRDVYPLVQLHLHTPSEHLINGAMADGEIHFVHIRDDGRITVVGVFLTIGSANPEIQKILDNTPNTPGVKTHNETEIPFNPKALLPKQAGKSRFFTYSGSLTTPPCTEGVNWYLFETPITLSQDQLTGLKDFYDENARLLQSQEGRIIATNK